MKSVETSEQYQEALKRIDELMIKIGDNHSYDNPEFIMMDRLSDLVADYEDEHFKIAIPSLTETIKLRMYELGLK